MVRRELPTAAGGDGQKSADSVEKVGSILTHSPESGKMPDLRVAMRNLEQFSAGSGLDFNVSRPLSRAKITEGLFQQNRPIAVAHQGLFPTQAG